MDRTQTSSIGMISIFEYPLTPCNRLVAFSLLFRTDAKCVCTKCGLCIAIAVVCLTVHAVVDNVLKGSALTG